MKKRTIFECIAAVLLILIFIVFYVAVAGNPLPGIGSHALFNIKNNVASASSWEVSGVGPVSDLHVDNGTLYVFMGDTSNTIYAMHPNGKIKWTYNVSNDWRVKNVFYESTNYSITKSVYETYDGVLYLYVRENRTTFWNYLPNEDHPDQPRADDNDLEDRLMAISPNGTLLWDLPISEEHYAYGDTELTVKNGRVYMFDDYIVTVLNDQGSVLYRLQNVSNGPGIDENGYVYLVPAVPPTPLPAELADYYPDGGYMVPSSAVEAYGPDGDLYWHQDLGTPVISPLLYQNGTIWAPIQNGILALNTNGSIRWSKHYNITTGPFWSGSIGLYSQLPLDSRGNVYLYEEGTGDPMISKKSIHIIASNGTETVQDAGSFTPYETNNPVVYKMQYYSGARGPLPERSGHAVMPVDYMLNCTVTAYDAADNKELWSYDFVPNVTETVITDDNAGRLLSPKYQYKNATLGTFIENNPVSILPGKDVLFAIYSCADIESPIIINQSMCGYSIDVYALDKKNGAILWKKNLDTLVTSASVNNNTVYYGTLDGKVMAQSIGG